MPRQAYTPSCASASVSAECAPARDVATATTRVTPAAAARARISGASSPRCACVSITRCGSRRSCGVCAAHPPDLLLDDRVVELPIELARLLQRLPWAEVAR